jgi:ferritin-like metal-binding protein YciE
MQKATTTQELKTAFVNHLAQTKEQIVRLEKVFELVGKKAQAKKCEAMEGLIKESEGLIAETEAGSLTRDVALIMAAQKVEHYEIATYGGLAQLAKTLGRDNAKELLGQTLQEEKDTDMLLTQIAENHINEDAEAED